MDIGRHATSDDLTESLRAELAVLRKAREGATVETLRNARWLVRVLGGTDSSAALDALYDLAEEYRADRRVMALFATLNIGVQAETVADRLHDFGQRLTSPRGGGYSSKQVDRWAEEGLAILLPVLVRRFNPWSALDVHIDQVGPGVFEVEVRFVVSSIAPEALPVCTVRIDGSSAAVPLLRDEAPEQRGVDFVYPNKAIVRAQDHATLAFTWNQAGDKFFNLSTEAFDRSVGSILMSQLSHWTVQLYAIDDGWRSSS